MALFNKKEQMYLETDPLGVALRASFLQVRDEMLFSRSEASNSSAPGQ